VTEAGGIFVMNASFLPVNVIDCDQELGLYPDLDAVNCHVPGTPVMTTDPDESVVISNGTPEPSEPVTCTFWRIGPLAESSCTYKVNVTEAALTGATIAARMTNINAIQQILLSELLFFISKSSVLSFENSIIFLLYCICES
jgi:hypothetical protein